MLAAQGVAAHAAIMECFRRAMHPDTPEEVAIKLRANVAQLSRTFSVILHDMERRQGKPLTERPKIPPLASSPGSGSPPDGPPPEGPPPDGSLGDDPAPRRAAQRESSHPPKHSIQYIPLPDNLPVAEDFPELPDDIETRPDGTPGSLTAYTSRPEEVVFVPQEPAIMVALATRPREWRIVNEVPDLPEANHPAWEQPMLDQSDGQGLMEDPGSADSPTADATAEAEHAWPSMRGPLDLKERIFTGDALARFASARFDPDAPIEPLDFEHEDSVVELELISTGGDPEAEAERAAMIAAHPEGKPVVTFRYGTKTPPDDTSGDT